MVQYSDGADTRSQIARWERGLVEPGFDTLRRVLRACGLDISETLVSVPAAKRPVHASRG